MPKRKASAYPKERTTWTDGISLPYSTLPKVGPDGMTVEQLFREACGDNKELADHLVSLLGVIKEK